MRAFTIESDHSAQADRLAKMQERLGVSRAAAEAVMRQLEKVQIPGLRKVYVKRSDVLRLLQEGTQRA